MAKNTPEQMALDIRFHAAMSREDFFVSSCNQTAFALVSQWPEWHSPALLLYGDEGCGKTHLSHIWQAESKAMRIDDVDNYDLDTAAYGTNIIIENADRIAGNEKLEQLVFHLYNIAKETETYLLLTSRKRVRDWGIKLPDLQSRLKSIMVAEIKAPDDQLLAMLFVKLFSDRQMIIDARVITYLSQRMERSFPMINELVEKLDSLSLEQGRRVTVPLARHVLEEFS